MDNMREKLSMNDVAAHSKALRQNKWPKILDAIGKV